MPSIVVKIVSINNEDIVDREANGIYVCPSIQIYMLTCMYITLIWVLYDWEIICLNGIVLVHVDGGGFRDQGT